MKYSKGATKLIGAAGFESSSFKQLAQRIEATLPHLVFKNWRASRSRTTADMPSGSARWKDNTRTTVAIDVVFGTLRMSTECARGDGPTVSPEDYTFLDHLVSETARRAEGGFSGPITVVDLGVQAVAAQIREQGRLDFDPLPVIQFVRALAQDSYENQRLSYGLVFSPKGGGTTSVEEAFVNKRFKALTDGFTTSIVVDKFGYILDLVPLSTPSAEGLARQKRPWWAAGLAEVAKSQGGIGIALTRNGDILVLENGALVFTQRAGVWKKWNHPAIIALLFALWDFKSRAPEIKSVLIYLYHLALDLSYRRHGGLLVVSGSQLGLSRILMSRQDRLGSSGRRGPELGLDKSLASKPIYKIDRRLMADLASMDGAVVVDRGGNICAYGAMTKSSRSAHQGARTRAAYGASRDGLAIKVSSDGDIGFFRNGKKRFEI